MRHEIVSRNPDVEVRFYLSVDEGSYVTPHWHDSIELVYMIEGSILVSYEKHKREIGPGEFAVVNSRVIHSVLSSKNQALVLQIPKEVLRKYVPDVDDYMFEIVPHPSSEEEQARQERVKSIFVEMQTIYNLRPKGYLLKFNSLLYDLLFTLIHSYSHKIVRNDFDKKSKYLERLNEIMAYLKNHYKERIALSELARQFGYSPDYLARFFKKQTGMTMNEYLYAYRITKVYQELLNTDKSIQEIFEENGCTNYRVAMREFRKYYGCTPKQRRMQAGDGKVK